MKAMSKGWVATKIGPRTYRYRFHGKHVRRPWLVVRGDGSLWGRYEHRADARLWVHVFNQPPIAGEAPYRVGYKRRPKKR